MLNISRKTLRTSVLVGSSFELEESDVFIGITTKQGQ